VTTLNRHPDRLKLSAERHQCLMFYVAGGALQACKRTSHFLDA
jgi:hypothetical protein